MRRFLADASRFLAPLAAAVAAIAWLSLAASRAVYRSRIALPGDARFVAIGDSEPACALDPGAFPGLVNQAAAAQSLDQVLYKVRDLLEVNAGRDFTVVLELSPRRMCMGFPPLVSTDYESRYVLLNYLHLFDSRRPLGDPVRMFRDRVVPDAFHQATGYRFKKNRRKRDGLLVEVVWGRFTPSPGAVYVEDPDKARRETERYFELFSGNCREDPSFSRGAPLVDEIAGLVRSSGRRIVLLTTPWHRSLLAKIPQDVMRRFEASMAGLAARNGAEWVNDLRLDLPDSCFRDQNHLNSEGARRYSEILKARLGEGCLPITRSPDTTEGLTT